jgi:hypothetical protein
VWKAVRKRTAGNGRQTLLAAVVTFPGNDCVNFYVESANTQGVKVIETISASF